MEESKYMQAMILAAGLGTRLKPWTLLHPKALVPVEGEPMLGRVIGNLRRYGFSKVVVNVHHFAEQVVAYIKGNDFGVEIEISDETGRLLDTGGAILHASRFFDFDDGPVLIHNVDILGDANLRELMRRHEESGADSTLLVSDRESSRKLIFSPEMKLVGWHDVRADAYRPAGYVRSNRHKELAFSGIHVVGKRMVDEMRRLCDDDRFSVIDFLLDERVECCIKGYEQGNLRLIDIGKPETLAKASMFLF